MHLLAIIAVVGLLFWIFPSGAKYLFAAPLVGVALGGTSWAIAAMITSSLTTFNTFGWFLFGGIILAEIVAFRID